jgi:hypothetical protein
VREDHALGLGRQLHVRQDLVRAATDIDRRRLRHRGGVGVVDVARPRGLTSRPFVADLLNRILRNQILK